MRKKEPKSFDRKAFGKKIKAFRRQIGAIQDDFAKGIKRTRSAYVMIENGTVAPSIDCMIDIIRYLGKNNVNVSLDYVLGLSENQNEAGSTKELKDKYDKLQREYESLKKINSLQEQLLEKKK